MSDQVVTVLATRLLACFSSALRLSELLHHGTSTGAGVAASGAAGIGAGERATGAGSGSASVGGPRSVDSRWQAKMEGLQGEYRRKRDVVLKALVGLAAEAAQRVSERAREGASKRASH